MHEDIKFQTANWGKKVTDIMADKTIGILGVAGGTQQVEAPAGWGGGGFECIRMSVLHTIDSVDSTYDYVNPNNVELADTACIDGLWMCARRSVWKEFRFDNHTFPGFHFYDVDFCTRVFTKYRVCVTFEILIEHFSRGSFDNNWYKNALHYYRKRRDYLPFGVMDIPENESQMLSIKALKDFTNEFIDRGISFKDSLYLVQECIVRSKFNRHSWWLLKKVLLNRNQI